MMDLFAPKTYYLVLHNDDKVNGYTVLECIAKVFNIPQTQAYNLMVEAHHKEKTIIAFSTNRKHIELGRKYLQYAYDILKQQDKDWGFDVSKKLTLSIYAEPISRSSKEQE